MVSFFLEVHSTHCQLLTDSSTVAYKQSYRSYQQWHCSSSANDHNCQCSRDNNYLHCPDHQLGSALMRSSEGKKCNYRTTVKASIRQHIIKCRRKVQQWEYSAAIAEKYINYNISRRPCYKYKKPAPDRICTVLTCIYAYACTAQL